MYSILCEFFGVNFLSPSDFFFISGMFVSVFVTIFIGLISRCIK